MGVRSAILSVDLFAHHFVARPTQHRPCKDALLDDARLGIVDGAFGGVGVEENGVKWPI